MTHAPSNKLVSCRAVLIALAAQDNVSAYGCLPYDEFGLTANQPSQPRVGGTAIPTTRPAVTALVTQPSVNDTSNRLPYDEFGLAANKPSQPQVGASAP